MMCQTHNARRAPDVLQKGQFAGQPEVLSIDKLAVELKHDFAGGEAPEASPRTAFDILPQNADNRHVGDIGGPPRWCTDPEDAMNEEDRRPSIPDDGNRTSNNDPTPHDTTAGETGGDDQQDFRFLAENARDAIVVVSRNGAFLYVNRRAYELTGYSAADRTRMTLAELIPNEEMDLVFALRAARHAGQIAPERYETSILNRSGRKIPVEITVAQITWKGQPADVGILRDISERKRAEEELRRRDAVLEAINFATDCFLSSPAWEERIGDILERM